MAYFEKLKDQKIVNFGAGSARTLVDRVIAGEYPIALEHFRPPSADQQGQGRAGEFAADGPGGDHGRDHGRGEGDRSIPMRRCCWWTTSCPRKASKSSRAPSISRSIPPSRRCRHWRRWCRSIAGRAGKFRRPRQAHQIYRQLRGDFPEAVPIRAAGQGRYCVEGRVTREHTGRNRATWTPLCTARQRATSRRPQARRDGGRAFGFRRWSPCWRSSC